MTELQATLEFSVELNKFYNVDLFQRGYYQIRTALKTPPKVPSKIEITLQKSQGDVNEVPAHVVSDTAVSRTFQILYRNEEVAVNDVILFRFHTLVNSTKLEEELSKVEIMLNLELWFSEEQNRSGGLQPNSEKVSQRIFNIHLNPMKGLHHHVPLLFDYFHLCCVEVTIHGTLIALHQPFVSVPKLPKSAWSVRNPELSTLETVYFGERPISADPTQCLPINLHAAWQMHHRICNMLLSAYESLQTTFEYYLNDICGSHFKLEHIDCHQKLQKIMSAIQSIDNEEELLQNGARDITQLCAANVILWTQFLETATLDQGIIFHLARDHHQARVKRFAEGFFTHEYQKNECLSCFEPSNHGHSDLAAMVRSSMYLQMLPALDLECIDLDGDYNSLPVIFEDIYQDHSSNNSCNTDMVDRRHSPSFSQRSPDSRVKSKRKNIIKNIQPSTFKRPSSFNLQEAEAAAASGRNPKDVTLVGYRKTMASPNVHSRVIENNLELGTLSPMTTNDSASKLGPLSNSVSLPLLERSEWSRHSDGTLPEYMQVARRSLRAKKKQRNKKSVITVDFGGSDPDLNTNAESDEMESPSKLKRAFTEPARHSSKMSAELRQSQACTRTRDNESAIEAGARSGPARAADSGRDSLSSVQSEHSAVGKSVQSESPNSNNAKKQLNFQEELYQNLSNCLSKTLSTDELHDSDKSDDETCVQNGFDEFLDEPSVIDKHTDSPSGLQTEGKHQQSATGWEHEDSARVNDKDTSNAPEHHAQSGLTVRDLLKSNVLQLTKPGAIADHTDNHVATNGKAASNSNNNAVSDVNLTEMDITNDSENSVQDKADERDCDNNATSMDDLPNDSVVSSIGLASTSSDRGKTGSPSAASKEDTSIEIITDKDLDSDKEGEQRVTVIELLKEEYNRTSISAKDHLELNQSLSDFSDSGVSVASVINNHKASSDSNILQLVETMKVSENSLDVKHNDVMSTSASFPDISKLSHTTTHDHPKLVDKVGHKTVNFITMRENLKLRMKYPGNLYSESSTLASQIPYFHVPDTTEDVKQDGCHLVVCVHGLDGNSADLRLVKTYMEMALPGYRLEFLMSEKNQSDTFADFEVMTKRLVNEVVNHIEMYSLKIARISFIGHSLGTVIIRSALTHKEMFPLLSKLHTFLSLSGPHLGTLYNNSGLVNMGMWFMQKWKKSGSLLQLSLKDTPDPRHSFLYELSRKPGLQFFKQVLLVGSSQDRYVPYHSSRIEMCKAAQREPSGLGSVYSEMVSNILQPIVDNPTCKLVRYDVFHALPSTANTMIGRAAHIAVLDSEIFIEKFLMVCALKYFK